MYILRTECFCRSGFKPTPPPPGILNLLLGVIFGNSHALPSSLQTRSPLMPSPRLCSNPFIGSRPPTPFQHRCWGVQLCSDLMCLTWGWSSRMPVSNTPIFTSSPRKPSFHSSSAPNLETTLDRSASKRRLPPGWERSASSCRPWDGLVENLRSIRRRGARKAQSIFDYGAPSRIRALPSVNRTAGRLPPPLPPAPPYNEGVML